MMTKWIIIIVIAVIILGLAGYCYSPKTAPSDATDTITLHYRGFGIPGMSGLLGKIYFQLTSETEEGSTWVAYDRVEYNPFRQRYPDGTLHAEGECMVELHSYEPEPIFDLHDLTWGKFYKPDGSLGSEVKDGTGVQRYWTPDGQLAWELVLENGKRKHLKMWTRDGEPKLDKEYDETVPP